MKEQDFPKDVVSGGERLQFSYVPPTHMAPYAYRLEGTHYGQPWSVHLNRHGLKMLILAMLEAL